MSLLADLIHPESNAEEGNKHNYSYNIVEIRKMKCYAGSTWNQVIMTMVIKQTCLSLIRGLFVEHGLDEEDNNNVIMTKLSQVGRIWEQHIWDTVCTINL